MAYGKKPGWQLWEEETAKRVGGDLVKASGRLTGYKGDVKTSDILVDCKYTETQRYTMSAKMWRSVSDWAMNEMRAPMIAVKIASGREVGIMRYRDFRDLWSGNDKCWDSYAVCDRGVRMSLGLSEKTLLPMKACMADGAWSEEVITMELSDMLRMVGIDED
jgi:hypothetical protein